MPNQWVAIRPEQIDSTAPSVSMQLPHPRTGENARYVVQADGAMLEIQKIEADHKQSWFIGNSVQKDERNCHRWCFVYDDSSRPALCSASGPGSNSPKGTLRKILQTTSESEGRFVQVDDIFHGQDDAKYKALHHLSRIPDLTEQMQHLCDKQEFAPGMYSYRLNQDKTLRWLRLKVESISSNIQNIPILLQFAKEQLFDIDAPETNDRIKDDAYVWTGIQVVTEYLPTTWQTRLAQTYNAAPHSAFSLSELEKQVEEHKKKLEIQMQNYCTTSPTEYAKVKREGSNESDQSTKATKQLQQKSKLSAGQRTLAKANIKGMKSLTSFFGKK
ncbi:hypothetical protein NQZ79_g5336 [Umbelopsis isabellina]|nr:hypothetical protein NQZ79_g5336 [Umbelopsis isabellina]